VLDLHTLRFTFRVAVNFATFPPKVLAANRKIENTLCLQVTSKLYESLASSAGQLLIRHQIAKVFEIPITLVSKSVIACSSSVSNATSDFFLSPKTMLAKSAKSSVSTAFDFLRRDIFPAELTMDVLLANR